ncbi:MATE family efflux transporter [Anaerolineales bacterium HSG24]|nr:MATE family efflux transporter [Anaerolineales bacterium HSG24]
MTKLAFFQDRQFFETMFRLAIPIIIQNIIMFSLNMVDIIMIGQLGETAVAAVGLADQIFFLMLLFMFGVGSGAAIFTAQYWGKRDIVHIQQTLGLCLMISLCGAIFFAIIALFFSEFALGIYTTDPEVIRLGSNYLQIVGLSYVAVATTVGYSSILRSIEQVKLPTIVSAIAIVINTSLNYVLIFGHFGFPALGVVGAAIATAIARYLECIMLLTIIYSQKLALAATIPQMINRDIAFISKFFYTSAPVVLTEIGWSLGITTYNIIYARISTDAIAAISIAATVERLAFVLFLGLGSAAAIMIGNLIGAGEVDRAFDSAKRFLIIVPITASFVGMLLLAVSYYIPLFYQISEAAVSYLGMILFLAGLLLPLRMTNFTLFIGILRSGGDTRFSLILDVGAVWLIGVPMAYYGGFVLGLPVYWVYLMAASEELFKVIIGLWRVFSRRWIHELTEVNELIPPTA